ncbi:hypothetical protein Tco_1336152 [Tanacetum coccineum]
MSSASSAVTYTSVYTDSEPGRVFWGADEEISDRGVPRVIVLGYDGLPMQPVHPASPDYVPGPEHPASPDYVPGPEHPPSPIEIPYVPEPEYAHRLLSTIQDEAPMEDQPLPADASRPAAGIRMRAADASPPLSLPPTSPRTDIPEAEMPPRKRACLTTPAPGYEIGESSAAGAARQPGHTPALDTWDEIVEAMMELAPTTLEGVDQRVTELDTTVRQRTEEFEIRFERHVATLIAHTTSLQTQLTTALGRIATLEARDPEP